MPTFLYLTLFNQTDCIRHTVQYSNGGEYNGTGKVKDKLTTVFPFNPAILSVAIATKLTHSPDMSGDG